MTELPTIKLALVLIADVAIDLTILVSKIVVIIMSINFLNYPLAIHQVDFVSSKIVSIFSASYSKAYNNFIKEYIQYWSNSLSSKKNFILSF